MKTAITWFAFREDYKIVGQGFVFEPNGFSATIFSDIIEQYKFDKHVILCTSDSTNSISNELEKKKKMLLAFQKERYPNQKVELRDVGIDKQDLQDFPIIEGRLRSFLQSLDATHELHVIAGTGPTAVGMAWGTLNVAMENRFRLHVLKRKEYTLDGLLSTLSEIKPYVSKFLDDKLREYQFNLDLPKDIFSDNIIEKEYQKAKAISPAAEVNVLLLGETGCGKDRMAEYIVNNSPMDRKKYRAINCASLPDELLYSELFGHVKGAFTGAHNDRIGLFEECNGGTLFLDEIGDISPFMQQSLLRAIENGQVKRAGTNEVSKDLRVRIIAATNNNLYEKCNAGNFRWDLYYRLCTMEIELQPYRVRTMTERKKVIKFYIDKAEKKWGKKVSFSTQAFKAIEEYSFPGNFREIYNTMNGLFALGKNELGIEDLPKRFLNQDVSIDETYESVMRSHCRRVFEKNDQNIAATCKALGYKNQTQLKKKFEEWKIL